MATPEAVEAAKQRRDAARARVAEIRQWWATLAPEQRSEVGGRNRFEQDLAAALDAEKNAEADAREAQRQLERVTPRPATPRQAPTPAQQTPGQQARDQTAQTNAQNTVSEAEQRRRNQADPKSGLPETDVQRAARESREAKDAQSRTDKETARQRQDRLDEERRQAATRPRPPTQRIDSPVQIATANNQAASTAETGRHNLATEQRNTVNDQVDALYKAGVLTQDRRNSIQKDAENRYNAEMKGIDLVTDANKVIYTTAVQQRGQDVSMANARLQFTGQMMTQVMTRMSQVLGKVPKGSGLAGDFVRGMLMQINSSAKEWGGMKEIAHAPIPQNLLKVAGYQLPDQLPTMPTSAEVDWRLAVSMAASGTPLPGWQGPIGVEALRLSREPAQAQRAAGTGQPRRDGQPSGQGRGAPTSAEGGITQEKVQAAIQSPQGQAIIAEETASVNRLGPRNPANEAQYQEANNRIKQRLTSLVQPNPPAGTAPTATSTGAAAATTQTSAPASATPTVEQSVRDGLTDTIMNGKPQEKARLLAHIATYNDRQQRGEQLAPHERALLDTVDPQHKALAVEAFSGQRAASTLRALNKEQISGEEQASIKEGIDFVTKRATKPAAPAAPATTASTPAQAPPPANDPSRVTTYPGAGSPLEQPTPLAGPPEPAAATPPQTPPSTGGTTPPTEGGTPVPPTPATQPAINPTNAAPSPETMTPREIPFNANDFSYVDNGRLIRREVGQAEGGQDRFTDITNGRDFAGQASGTVIGADASAQMAATPPPADPVAAAAEEVRDLTYVDNGRLIRREVGAAEGGQDRFTDVTNQGENRYRNFTGVASGTAVAANDERYDKTVRASQMGEFRRQLVEGNPALGPLMDRADRGEQLNPQEQFEVDRAREQINRGYFQGDQGVPQEADTGLRMARQTPAQQEALRSSQAGAPTGQDIPMVRINLDTAGTESREERTPDGKYLQWVKAPETQNQWIAVDADDPNVRNGSIPVRTESGTLASQRELAMPQSMLEQLVPKPVAGSDIPRLGGPADTVTAETAEQAAERERLDAIRRQEEEAERQRRAAEEAQRQAEEARQQAEEARRQAERDALVAASQLRYETANHMSFDMPDLGFNSMMPAFTPTREPEEPTWSMPDLSYAASASPYRSGDEEWDWLGNNG